MAGNKEGGKKTAQRIKELYGDDFYSRMGKVGGSKGRTGGFASEKIGPDGLTGRQRASLAGSIGGQTSKRNRNEYDTSKTN